MISIDPTLLIIMGEVMIALVVAIVAILFVFVKGKRRDQAAVQALQGKINSNASNRQAMFEDLLANSTDENEEEVVARKEMAASWVNKENEFYGRLVDMYLKRNASALKGLDKLLHEYTSSYLDLVTLMRDRVESGQIELSEEATQRLEQMAEEGERLNGRVKSLEGENRVLNKELKDAYREIEQTMREYTKAFRPAAGVASDAGSMPGRADTAAAGLPKKVSADLESDEVNDEDVADLAAALDGFPQQIADENDGGNAPAQLEKDAVVDGGLLAAEAQAESSAEEIKAAVVDNALPSNEKTDLSLQKGKAAEDLPEILDEEAFFSQDQEVPADAPSPADEVLAEEGKRPVIDLADDGDIVLPELEGVVDEDELLAQLESMEQEDDVTALSKDKLAGEDKKSADST